MRLALITFFLCVTTTSSPNTSAAEPMTPNTLRLAQGEPSPAATIDDMAWYAGTWRGAGLGGNNEEIWSPPMNGSMMGMYRLFGGDGAVFYEFLTIVEERGSLTLRLKHFHPDLRGWEDRDEQVRMPLVAKREGRIYFDGLTFEPQADGSVTIYLAIESRKGAVREEVFKYQRFASPR